MAIRKTAIMGNPLLRQRSKEIPVDKIKSKEVQNLIDDLIETMHEYDGVGIAAPQVHENVKMFCAEIEDNPRYPGTHNAPLTIIINPKITPLTEDKNVIWEGCLSVPGIRGPVKRFAKVKVDGFNREGNPISFEAEDFWAGVMQHENDHLDGVLFVDKVVDTRLLSFLEEFKRYHLSE